MNNLFALKDFGFLSVTGRDAQKFLQGYTTCDLEDLGEQEVRSGAICNIKGRMVCNFMICRESDGFLLRVKRSLIEPTVAFLGKYIVFSKATAEDRSADFNCYGSLSADDNFPQALHEITPTPEGRILRLSEQRYELWVTSSLEADGDVNGLQLNWLTGSSGWMTRPQKNIFLRCSICMVLAALASPKDAILARRSSHACSIAAN